RFRRPRPLARRRHARDLRTPGPRRLARHDCHQALARPGRQMVTAARRTRGGFRTSDRKPFHVSGRRLRISSRLLLLSLVFLAACGGSSKSSGGGASEVLLATGQNGDLNQISLPGGAQTTVVHFKDASVLDPAVSADGSRIAFVRAPDYTVGQ